MQIEGNKRAHKQVWATNIKHWVKTEKLKRPWLVQRRALIQSRPLTYKQFKKHKLKSLEWPSPLSKNIPELEVICKEKDENSQKLSGSSGDVFLLIIAHSSIHCSCTPGVLAQACVQPHLQAVLQWLYIADASSGFTTCILPSDSWDRFQLPLRPWIG